MRALFKISTGVLLATAIMLVGQGIHSFEEVGLLASRPMPFFRLEFLGIYPDRLGLMAQLALLVIIATWTTLGVARRTHEGSVATKV
jgi:high-affinity iron transporter